MRPLSVDTPSNMYKINTLKLILKLCRSVLEDTSILSRNVECFLSSHKYFLFRSIFFSETYDEPFPIFPAEFLHIALAYLLTGKTWQSFLLLYFLVSVYLKCIVSLWLVTLSDTSFFVWEGNISHSKFVSLLSSFLIVFSREGFTFSSKFFKINF